MYSYNEQAKTEYLGYKELFLQVPNMGWYSKLKNVYQNCCLSLQQVPVHTVFELNFVAFHIWYKKVSYVF